MKKYYSIFIFSFLFFSSIYAQDYVPILQEGSFWDTQETGSGCFYINRLAIDKDTIINSVNYKSLKSLYFRSSNGQVDCLVPPYTAHESDFEEVLGYFLREDVTEKRLYIYVSEEHGDPGEYLLADFTLEVGDELANPFGGIPMNVSNLNILPDGRRKYTMGDGTIVTEGIGKENGQLRIYGSQGNGVTYSYYCHGNTGNQNGCLETLSVEDPKLQQIKIFPNPTSDILQLSNLENNSFKLYSLLGKELDFEFSPSMQQMNISHLQSGIYLLEIRSENNAKRIVKILKN